MGWNRRRAALQDHHEGLSVVVQVPDNQSIVGQGFFVFIDNGVSPHGVAASVGMINGDMRFVKFQNVLFACVYFILFHS
jgi:hypothetical protein